MESPLSRFSATVEDYRRYRPGYPEHLWAWIEDQAGLEPGARALDLGCGTGITTGGLLERRHRVVGLDPNGDMIAAARTDHPRAGFVRAQVERMPLQDASFDLAVGGQCFHWFDLERACAELDRIVAPGGHAAAFWNARTKGPFEAGYDALLHAYSEEFRRVRTSSPTLADLNARIADRDPRRVTLENHQDLTLETFIGRARSSSYVMHGVDDLPGLERDLGALFEAHAKNGIVRLHYDLVARLWTCRRPT